MTTKSIQQRAEEYAKSEKKTVTALFSGNPSFAVSYIPRQSYAAGATDERRELGKVILQAYQTLLSAPSAEKLEDQFIVWADEHAELIAKLREELK